MAALPALAFWPLVTPDSAARASIQQGDFTEVHYPMHRFVVRSWQQHRLPLWAPGVNGGQPAFADIQFDAFYPPTVLTGLLLGRSGDFTPRLLIGIELGHLVFGELGVYLLVLRLLGSRRAAAVSGKDGVDPAPRPAAIPAALSGAVIFGFSGYLTTYPMQDTDILQVSVWLPWAILALDRALVQRRVSLALVAGLPLGLAALAGHPQILLYIFYAHLLYTLMFASTTAIPGRRVGAVGIGGAALLVGLALGALQLLPTLELAPQTVRSSESFAFLSGGFAPHDLVGTVLSEGFGGAAPAYLGVIPLILVVLGSVRGLGGVRLYALALGAIALLLSLGRNAFLYAVAYRAMPGFAEVRDQERAIYLVTFAVALLAANGVQQVCTEPVERSGGLPGAALEVLPPQRSPSRRRGDVQPPAARSPRRPALAGATPEKAAGRLAATGGALALVGMLVAALLLNSSLVAARLPGQAAATALVTNLAGLHRLLLLSLAGFTLFTASALFRRRAVSAWLLAGLCAVDLLTAHHGYGTQRGDANPYPDWGIIRFLQSDGNRPFRISSEGLLPADGNEGLIYGLEDVVGSTPLELSRFQAMNTAEQQHRLDALVHLALLNVRYVVTRRTFPAGAPLQLLGSHGDAHLYRLAPALTLPRVWLVQQAVVVAPPKVWAALGTVADVRRQAVLTGPPPALMPGGHGTVRIKADGDTRLALRVTSSAPALLVISQIYYPGWQATVDGAPAPVLLVDGALDGVAVPGGAHRVDLRFAPLSLRLGAAVTAGALLSVVIVSGLGWRRRLPSTREASTAVMPRRPSA